MDPKRYGQVEVRRASIVARYLLYRYLEIHTPTIYLLATMLTSVSGRRVVYPEF